VRDINCGYKTLPGGFVLDPDFQEIELTTPESFAGVKRVAKMTVYVVKDAEGERYRFSLVVPGSPTRTADCAYDVASSKISGCTRAEQVIPDRQIADDREKLWNVCQRLFESVKPKLINLGGESSFSKNLVAEAETILESTMSLTR
jgi:hypothetical protein